MTTRGSAEDEIVSASLSHTLSSFRALVAMLPEMEDTS